MPAPPFSEIWWGMITTGSSSSPEAAEVDEHVGDEHRHRAVGEVDHAGAAVLEDETLAEDGVGRAGAEAEDQEQDVAGHGGYVFVVEVNGRAHPPAGRRAGAAGTVFRDQSPWPL